MPYTSTPKTKIIAAAAAKLGFLNIRKSMTGFRWVNSQSTKNNSVTGKITLSVKISGE